MQVLFEGSDEDADAGLGVLARAGRSRLPDEVKVPHMGWNTVEWTRAAPVPRRASTAGDRFYFVHSYAPDVDDRRDRRRHGPRPSFASAVARDNVFATQFHPEKSGDAGLQHLRERS